MNLYYSWRYQHPPHPPSEMDRCNRQKISKDRVELNNIINQLDIRNMYRLLHPTAGEYTFFSSSHWMIQQDRPHSRS